MKQVSPVHNQALQSPNQKKAEGWVNPDFYHQIQDQR